MKILKPGKPVHTERKFVCRGCGCEFVAVRGEYATDFYCNEYFYKCYCPNCGNISYDSEEVKENEQA